MEITIFGASSLAIGAIGLFAALVLALYPSDRSSDSRWLSLFLVGLSLPMLMGFFEEAGLFGHALVFYPLVVSAFLAGPSLYLYARLPWQKSLRASDWIHASPLAIGAAAAIYWGRLRYGDSTDAFMLWAMLLYLSGSTYSILTLRLLKRYRRALNDHFSDTYRRRLHWLRFAAWGLLALIGTDVAFGMLLQVQASATQMAQLSISLILSLLIFLLSLSALRRPARYVAEIAAEPDVRRARYATSGVNDETLGSWRSKLEALMREDQPYLENDLSLADLAGRLDISPHNLSQLLNQSLGVTFYDFVNQARIRHACDLLASGSDSVLDVAFASGFNNKASFYSAFRHQMQTTPGAYRQSAADPARRSSAA